MGAVVDDGGQVCAGFEHRLEMRAALQPRTRGISISPAATTLRAWAAKAAARGGLSAPVPTTTGTPAATRHSTPCIRASSLSSGQSPIKPQ